MPHCLALVMPPGMPGPEQACTLVVAEARMGIRLKVSAVFEKGRGPGPRLFLRSWDDPRRPVYPVPGQLRVGDQELTVQVPVGDYGAAVLPLGRFKVFPEEQVLRARPGREVPFEIQVVAKTRRTEVKLLGLSSRDLPVTVSPRPTGELLTGAQQMLFCGPYRWPTATQRIHAPSGPVILVVFSRKKSWISDRVVNFTRNEESVRLLRASRVFVRWYSNRPLQGEEAIVTVQSRLGDEEVLLKPALLQLAGLTRGVLSGSVVVPQGRVKLDCTLGRSGARAWVRVITAKGPVAGVTIDK